MMLETRPWNPPARPTVNGKLVMIAIWLLAFAFMKGCAAQVAYAQTYFVKASVQSCTLVDCRVLTQVASAVCVGKIGREWCFVSAGHCFFDYDSRPAIIKSVLKSADVAIDEQWVRARFVRFAQPGDASDLAVLSVPEESVPSRRALKCLPIATAFPAVGSDVTLCGFPSGGKYNESRGTVVSAERGTFKISPAVVQGVSGGPAVSGGQVVGIVSLSDFASGTYVVGPQQVRQRLVGWFGRMPDCGQPQNVPPQSSPAQPPNEVAPESWGNSSGGDAPLWDPSPGAPPQQMPVQPPSGQSPPAPPAEESGSVAGAIASGAAGLAFNHWAVPILIGALGGGPIGMAGVWLGGKIIRRLASRGADRVSDRIQERRKSRREASTHTREYIEVPVPVETQLRPPSAKVVRTNEYVPVEVNPDAEALQWAKRKLVERYPESASAVEVLDSLMKQYRDATTGKG